MKNQCNCKTEKPRTLKGIGGYMSGLGKAALLGVGVTVGVLGADKIKKSVKKVTN